MTSKTSLFKKGLLLSDFKRFWWASALYGLLLFFMLPLKQMMLKNAVEHEWVRNQIKNSLDLFHHQNSLQILLTFVVPVLLAVLVFRYMQKPNAAAMIHSLPFNRKTLYASHSTAGLLLMVLPVVIIAFILMILQTITILGEYYSFIDILRWFGYTLFFNSLFFSIAVFVGMFTGNSIAQMAFTYILHMLPAGIYMLYRYNMEQLLHGYTYTRLYESALDHLPMLTLLNNRIDDGLLPTNLLLSYTVLMVVFFIAAYCVYKIRNIEVASDVIAFTPIQPIFKYGVTVCSMLLGGIYFSSILGDSFATIVFGYLFSSLLGYIIAEMLLQKSFRVWSAYRGYLAYAFLLLLMLTGLKMDVIGYVGRIPDIEEVEKVYFNNYIYSWNRFEEEADIEDSLYFNNYFFVEEENIENVMKLHEALAQSPRPISGRSQYIVYTLKNDKHLVREYILNEKEYASLLKPIYESVEYKQRRFPIVVQNPDAIKLMEVVDHRSPKQSVILADSVKIQELVGLLQGEIQKSTFEELTFSKEGAPTILITDNKERRIGYAIRNSYTSVIQWLKDEGIYQSVMLLPEDIDYIVLEKRGETSGTKRVEIKDPQVIEELLNLSSYLEETGRDETLWVGFYIKNTSGYAHHMEYISQAIPASDALRAYLNQLDTP